MSQNKNARKVLNDSIISEIIAAVESLEYGEVNIKVHNKKIIQIEISARKRFDDLWKAEEGGGI